MELNIVEFGRKHLLEIDDARIIFRNFAGVGGMYNREGDRSFSLVIPTEEIKDLLMDLGYNVRIKEPKNEGQDTLMHLPIKVSYKIEAPKVYLQSGTSKPRELDESTIAILDNVDIERVDLDVSPSYWTNPRGESGVSAYLKRIIVTQRVDRFAARYEDFTDNE